MPKLARSQAAVYSSSSRGRPVRHPLGLHPAACSTSVLKEVQILECLSQLSGVYFGDEGCGGPVLEPADEQRVSEDTYIPEDEADT
ncbi:uncharacterized protein LOC108640160 [Manacus vitellinus]|uniref:uncharacterized protein LOC108640160 n=1 Tax=Manacus vitellinus TaxID=328815 RepID=UPI00115E6B94|nr:uncharacterized protein LOC108640160 [Manacus vitellinus]